MRLEVLFHFSARTFGLLIGLRPEGSAEAAVDPKPVAQSRQHAAANCGPWSETMVSGRPWRRKTCATNMSACSGASTVER